MALLDNDPFLVSLSLEIQSILHSLLKKRALIRLSVPRTEISIISTILEYDSKNGTIILDNSADEDTNTRFLRAPEVELQGLLDRVSIEFKAKLRLAKYKDGIAFETDQPNTLRRVQRREFYRVEIPHHNVIYCTVEDNIFPDKQIRFPITDISGGGIQITDTNNSLDKVPIGTIFDKCTLELPDEPIQNIKMRLQRTSKVQLEGGKFQHLAGFRFIDIPRNREVTIQQYIGQIERAAAAKRWGND